LSGYILNDTGGFITLADSSGFVIYEYSSVSQISYADRSISLPYLPYRWNIDPQPRRTITPTLTGAIETICQPCLDIHVTGGFHLIESASLRAALHNWWQWACRGLPWSIALDWNMKADTTLTAHAHAGDTTIQVVSVQDIVPGNVYKLFGGPNYQHVTVASISGLTLTLTKPLNMQFPGIDPIYPVEYRQYAAVLRDQNYFIGSIRDSNPELPIIDGQAQQANDIPARIPQRWFRLSLDFHEYWNVPAV
jgi:hypothetical protein